MDTIKITDAELKFMNMVWENAPINSTELVKLANNKLGWKKSTTYTVIRNLCKRNILQNENATVNYLIDRESIQYSECDQIINKIYDGSLKLFLTAFLEKEKLSQKDADELKKIIDENMTEGK
jgi:predicted transcriptional regulator